MSAHIGGYIAVKFIVMLVYVNLISLRFVASP